MRYEDIALNVKIPSSMIEKVMAAGNGVHRRHFTIEIFVQNLKGPSIDSTGIFFDYCHKGEFS